MRTIISFLIICIGTFQANAKEIRLPGKIKNPMAQTVILVTPAIALGTQIKIDTFTLNEYNAFQFELNSQHPFVAEFIHGNLKFPVFINPDQPISIMLSLEDSTDASISFIGPGAVDNHFYLAYWQYTDALVKEWKEGKKITNTKKYLQEIKQFAASKSNFLLDYESKHQVQLSETLKQWVKYDISYLAAFSIFLYPQTLGTNFYLLSTSDITTKDDAYKFFYDDQPNKFVWKAFNDKEQADYDSRLSFLGSFDINNESAIYHPAYQKFIEVYFYQYKILKENNAFYAQSYEEQFKIAEKYYSGHIKYFLQSLVLKEAFRNHPTDVSKIYQQFIDSSAPLLLKKEIYELHHESQRSIQGEVLSLSAFQQINGSPVNPKLFEDKITYIFFWDNAEQIAKWEFSSLKRIGRRFAERDYVNVLLVNTNKDLVKVVASDQKYNFNLVNIHHLRLNQAIRAKFLKQYLIKELPEFFVIGPDGKVISGRSFPPSSGKVSKLLKVLAWEHGYAPTKY